MSSQPTYEQMFKRDVAMLPERIRRLQEEAERLSAQDGYALRPWYELDKALDNAFFHASEIVELHEGKTNA